MHNISWQLFKRSFTNALVPGRYSQWRSRFLRYIDTKGNGEYLRKCIFEGPYKLTSVVIEAVAATVNSPEVPEHDEAETVHNMSEENKLYFKAEKEAIFLLLTGIGDEIYSTVDACNTANEMWIAIERLQQGESLNIQDVKTNLFWEFGKFTSRDGESMSTSTIMVKFQKEVNDIRAERIAKSANPLALLAAAQPYSDTYYQAPKPQKIKCNIIFHKTKTEDTTPRYNNDNQSRQFGNQRTMTVAGAREIVGSQVVQQTGIQCFNCKGYGHYAKECRKPKRVKDYAYHKESDDVQTSLNKVQNHDESNVFANERRHSEQPESINDTYVLEKDDSNVTPDSSNICNNDIGNSKVMMFVLKLWKCGLISNHDACVLVVRLGSRSMIQPEPEDLPKDNPKLEIAVLSLKGSDGVQLLQSPADPVLGYVALATMPPRRVRRTISPRRSRRAVVERLITARVTEAIA
ncbi:retrovirus-related pol polyprotein from transposon TNT 1-94, partial [Tanacetum coccineum]